MSADEMFNKLGYKCKREIHENGEIYVQYINMGELQAINKKVDELGWIENN